MGIAVKGKRVGASASSESGIYAFTARASGGADVSIRRKQRARARRREALLQFFFDFDGGGLLFKNKFNSVNLYISRNERNLIYLGLLFLL